MAEVVMTALRPSVPAAIQPMVEAALLRPTCVTDVGALAEALGVHRKTLFNRCEHAAFVGPAELLTWTRLALVAYLLEWTGYTVENISLELGFPSPTALRNMMKRYTGLRPMEIRQPGGLELIVERLGQKLRELRSAPALDRAPARSQLHVL
jgi:AraC-like DNA-binding protein